MKNYFLPFFFFLFFNANAQTKKPLDHTVYDGWQSIGEKLISNDGAYVVYTINPQEGDGELVIQNPASNYKYTVPRGYSATITEDNRFLVFKIKPFFQDTRQAKIKKKKAAELPKDSLGIVELGKDSVIKIPLVKNYRTPEKGTGWVAYQLEKNVSDTIVIKRKISKDSTKTKTDLLVKLADSVIRKAIDSIRGKISNDDIILLAQKTAKEILKQKEKDSDEAGTKYMDAEGDETKAANDEGADVVLRNLGSGEEKIFNGVKEYYFDKKGKRLLIETAKDAKDSLSKAYVIIYYLNRETPDTVLAGFNDCKNFAFDEEGNQLAFVAERDSSEKALLKFYKLWYFVKGQDSASIIADKNTVGMRLGFTVSENGAISFSKDGSKLYFGNAPVMKPKDTTLVDFEMAKLDIWNYKDDYLQPQQLIELKDELKRSYTAVYHLQQHKLIQLGAEDAEKITPVDEGNADWVLAETNKGNRVDFQWSGRTRSTAYVINSMTGERKTIFKNLYANAETSPAGKFVYWYNPESKNYFTYEVATGVIRNVTGKIKVPLYDEENDVPDFPSNYGVMGWQGNDSSLLIYDRYEVWKTDPLNKFVPSLFFDKALEARKTKTTYRYVRTDKEERFIPGKQKLVFKVFDNVTKKSAYSLSSTGAPYSFSNNKVFDYAYNNLAKAKNDDAYIFTKESYTSSPDLYYSATALTQDKNIISGGSNKLNADPGLVEHSLRLSNINPQQKDYNWGTAELFTWKTYTGKTSTGIIYKPEDFDPKKKYPMICYFYEKLSDGLFTYHPPLPTPSRLNISFFVSRGYIVFAPDISYTTGHPGNDAYNYVVSGARAIVKKGFVDSTKLGIQGQSWGGYQVAYLVTKTKLFAAAWAGAPVANMTSAYGGIRWQSGLNRQFQYEKTQSRIGATLWDKPQLYIENSPLFHLPNVKTPLVIMHNDADGAVPWYQGIELFTGLRRLGKPVWMLNYNGEAHNLVERRNKKDIQIREQQFFDWQLKRGKNQPNG